jgi:branched-chain amino acid transport system permease protein
VAAARPLDWRKALIESGLTAFVVLVLALPMVGFELRDVPGAIELRTRMMDVAAAVAIAFAGRLALVLLREGRPRIVLAGAALYAVLLLLGLVGQRLFGAEFAAHIAHLVPFSAPVVRWCLWLFAVFLAIRAAVAILLPPAAAAPGAARVEWRIVLGAIGLVLVFLGIAFPLIPQIGPAYITVGILMLTYVMLGWGLNIVVGLAGLLDLGYVGFYAVGAYTAALVATTDWIGLGFWGFLPIAGAAAAFAGVILGFPVLRLRGDYLAIVTLGFGEMIRIVLLNFYSLTNGPNGVSGIPRPKILGLSWDEEPNEGETSFHQWVSKNLFELEFDPYYERVFLYYVVLVLALLVNWFTLRARRLPIGRAWEALREDEIACRSLGINPTNTKLTAFGVGAMFGGFAGAFFASNQGFISPESFTFVESAIILAIVVLGGFGSQIGVVLAAFILIVLPEIFREVKDYRMLAFGITMVLIMLWRPAGLLSHREPTIRLHGRGAK